MLQAEYFRKAFWKMRNWYFRLFWDDFELGVYGGVVLTWKRRSVLRVSTISTHVGCLIMCSLDSWLHGASAGYRVDYVYHNISGIKSNNSFYFRQVWRLLGGFFFWIQAKTDNLSVKVWSKTSETYIVKKITFYSLTPLLFWGSFWARLARRPAFTHAIFPSSTPILTIL